VNSKTENRKKFEGSSQARKVLGKVKEHEFEFQILEEC